MKNFNKLLILILSIYNVDCMEETITQNEHQQEYKQLDNNIIEKTKSKDNGVLLHGFASNIHSSSSTIVSDTISPNGSKLPINKDEKENAGIIFITMQNNLKLINNNDTDNSTLQNEWKLFKNYYKLNLSPDEDNIESCLFQTLFPIWNTINYSIKSNNYTISNYVNIFALVMQGIYKFVFELANAAYRWSKDNILCNYFNTLLMNDSFLNPLSKNSSIPGPNSCNTNNTNSNIYIIYNLFQSLQTAVCFLDSRETITKIEEYNSYQEYINAYNTIYEKYQDMFQKYNTIIHEYRKELEHNLSDRDKIKKTRDDKLTKLYEKHPKFQNIPNQLSKQQQHISKMSKDIQKDIKDKFATNSLLQNATNNLNNALRYCENDNNKRSISWQSKEYRRTLFKVIKQSSVKKNKVTNIDSVFKFYLNNMSCYISFMKEMLQEQIVSKHSENQNKTDTQ